MEIYEAEKHLLSQYPKSMTYSRLHRFQSLQAVGDRGVLPSFHAPAAAAYRQNVFLEAEG